MTAATEQRQPIVVGVDGSDRALDAVRWAAHAAMLSNSPLRLINVLGIHGLYMGTWPPSPSVRTTLAEHADKVLTEAENAARAVAPLDVEMRKDDGNPGPVLVEQSRTARLTVVGPDGAGRIGRRALGTTVLDVAVHAHGPVVVVRGDNRHRDSGPVVVGIDGSPVSEPALDIAYREAALRQAKLTAVHTWYDNDAAERLAAHQLATDTEPARQHAERLLAERLAGRGEQYPDVPVDRMVVRARAKPTLIELSATAQLMVVGSRGRGRFAAALLGSVSQSLITQADCPVLVVRPQPDAAAMSRR